MFTSVFAWFCCLYNKAGWCVFGLMGGEYYWETVPPTATVNPLSLEREEHWRRFDNSVNAVSFGFVATAILMSMFLVMAIFERFLRPTSDTSTTPNDLESHNIFNAKLSYPSPKVSCLSLQIWHKIFLVCGNKMEWVIQNSRKGLYMKTLILVMVTFHPLSISIYVSCNLLFSRVNEWAWQHDCDSSFVVSVIIANLGHHFDWSLCTLHCCIKTNPFHYYTFIIKFGLFFFSLPPSSFEHPPPLDEIWG